MLKFRVNLGGEGEEPDALNQQERRVVQPGWFCSQTGDAFGTMVSNGVEFLLCGNLAITLPDGCVDEAITNSVPIDIVVNWAGPGIQSSEIRRILKSGGIWTDNGVQVYMKP